MNTHRNTEGLRITLSIWSDILMIFTVYTHVHRSDLDSECVLSGESSVRELVSVYNPGVTKNLKGITAKMTQKLLQTLTYKQHSKLKG